jgi:hypothetical protein
VGATPLALVMAAGSRAAPCGIRRGNKNSLWKLKITKRICFILKIVIVFG